MKPISERPFEIHFARTLGEARVLSGLGHCPVECSFGEHSVVDELRMDHHGEWSRLEGVALRAYRDHWGARRSDPRFVVTGAADADATFAIAALAGLVPQPGPGARDLLPLATLINQADLSPIGLRLAEHAEGSTLLLFRQLRSAGQDALSFYAGVEHWRMLCGPNPPRSLLLAAGADEARRITAARAANVERVSDEVALVSSPVWGFDVWYAEVRPVIVAYVAEAARVTVGCRDAATAERLFGPGGLKNLLPLLQPPGWGGRETVGGSPRDARLGLDEARAAAEQIARCVRG